MIRFVARGRVPRWVGVAVPLGSIVLAMVVAGIVLAATGHDPVATYRRMVRASLVQPGALSRTLVSMTPLMFTGLAAAVAFRMRLWNIGGEGQLYLGAIGASGVAALQPDLPGPVLIPLMMAAGVLAGTLWASVPGALRAYLNTNEILTTLMLNYVAANVMYYLIYDSTSFWRDLTSPSARVFPQGKMLPDQAHWPAVRLDGLAVPIGLLLAVALAVLLWAMIRTTRYGFEMRVLADAPAVGRYAGIRIRRKTLSLLAVSGGIAGFGGASQIGDFSHMLDPRGLEMAGFGYAGIVVAALARYNPLAVVVTSFFIGMLVNAGFALQGPGFPIGLTGTMEGILLFCVLGAEVFTRYRLELRPRRSRAPTAGGGDSPAGGAGPHAGHPAAGNLASLDTGPAAPTRGGAS